MKNHPVGMISIILGLICLVIANPEIEDGIIISGPILLVIFSTPWYLVIKTGVILYKWYSKSSSV